MKLLPAMMAVAFAVASFSTAAAVDTAKKDANATAPAKAVASAPKKLTAQQVKMKTCNKEAKEQKLKGADRKTFMKTCLKKDAKAAEKDTAVQ